MSLVNPETGELLSPTFDWPAGVHPAADLFPMMDPISFSKLVEDIRVNGLSEPVILLPDDRLLDGRNRVAACQSIGRKVEVRVYHGDDPTGHVISLNVHRRHLTAGQLAMVAAEALPLFEAEAKARQGTRTDLATSVQTCTEVPVERNQARADVAAGAQVGVSGRSVSKAKRVMEAAPELVPLVKSGEMSITAADDQVTARKQDVSPIFKKLKEATVKHQEPGPKSAEAIAARVARVREMAAAGHTVPQIAAEIGVVEERVRHYAKQYDIAFPADVAKGAHRHDSNRIMTETVQTLDGLAMGVTLIDYASLDRSQIERWVSSLSASLKSLTTVKNNLNKELTRD